jgi:hypothetical protein
MILIELKLEETNFLTRWPCTVCGGCTEKDPILVEGDNCLKEGNIDRRLSERADRLEAAAKEVRSLIGQLKVPTYSEWQAAMRPYEAGWAKEHLRLIPGEADNSPLPF